MKTTHKLKVKTTKSTSVEVPNGLKITRTNTTEVLVAINRDTSQVVINAFEHLFNKIDFLGHQLSFGNGDLTEDVFNALADKYLEASVLSKEEIVDNICTLANYLKIERLNSDSLSMLLNCDICAAQEALNYIVSSSESANTHRNRNLCAKQRKGHKACLT